MAISSTKRALIAVAVMVCALAIAAVFYIHGRHLSTTTSGGATTEAHAGPSATPRLLTGLPGGAPVIGYVDLAALRELTNSPLGAFLGLATSDPQTDKEYGAFVRETGFDYTRDLDQAAIAVWPSSLDAAANGAGDNSALAIADGRFDAKKIEAYAARAGGRSERRGADILY